MANIDQVKELREITGISIMECHKALKEAGGDFEKAKEILKKWGKDFAQKKTERVTNHGIIESYIHPGDKVGVMIELRCETDFVAKGEDFHKLAHEICLQVAAGDIQEIPILEQPWIKDESKKIKDLIDEYIAKTGENITLEKFIRYEL